VRIAFVLGTFPRTPSGGALVVYQYASILAERGHEVRIVHVEARPSLVESARRLTRNIASGGVTTDVRWTRLHPDIRMERHVSYDTLDAEADEVIVPTFWKTVEPVLKSVPVDQRVVHFVQAYETAMGPPTEVEAVYRLPCPKIVVAPRLRDQLLALGVERDDVAVVTNGVDLALFPAGRPASLRPPRVTFMAGDVPSKGLEVAVRVQERVERVRPDVMWLAFGPGRRPSSLPRSIDYRRSVPQERLAEEFYQVAAVFLCTSHEEGWGLPALESMACGTPVVSTRNGGIENFAIDGETALLRDVGDADGLAEGVMVLLNRPGFRDEIAAKALAVGRAHGVRESAERFERALLDVP
jgi:L-malate glycosyltransferase